MQCKLVFQASVADSHLSFVWRVNFNWSWLICLYFGNRASPLASATASEPRVVWLFKFLNWPDEINSGGGLLDGTQFRAKRGCRNSTHQYWCLSINNSHPRMPFDSIVVEQYFNVGEGATAWLAERPPNDKKYFSRQLERRGRLSWKVGLFGPSCGRIRQMLITHIYIYIGTYICSSIDDLVPWSLGWTQHYRACLPHTNVCVSTSFSQYHLQNKSFAQPPLGPPE